LPHSATDQAKLGRGVSPKHLRRGDLVFWGASSSHCRVAIYAGHGRVIKASRARGAVIRTKLMGAVTARRLLPAL
jgi:cell wall-associated NlpC family hydrolase